MSIATPSFPGTGVKPLVSGAEALSTTLVKVTFNEAMANNAALKNASNYTIFPMGSGVSRSVVSAIPESGGAPTYVQLQLNGALTSAAEYKVLVGTTVEDLAGNTLDSAYTSAVFIAKWSTVSVSVSAQPPTEEDTGRKEKMITWLKSRSMLSTEAEKYIRRKRR